MAWCLFPYVPKANKVEKLFVQIGTKYHDNDKKYYQIDQHKQWQCCGQNRTVGYYELRKAYIRPINITNQIIKTSKSIYFFVMF